MKLIILDRDGVINIDSYAYIKSPDEWIPIPGSLAAIAQLNQAGFTVAVASNQSGIARGYYDHDILAAIHHKMHQALAAVGGSIDKVVYCPHHPDMNCACRKPEPGMLLEIAQHFNCQLTEVPFVGDRDSDVAAARAAGAKPILISSASTSDDVLSFENLQQVANYLIKE